MTLAKRIWTAALIVIGDEILSGRTHDKNIAQVASWLQVQGIRLTEVRVVADVQQQIIEAVNALRSAHDYLFTTGGIGPHARRHHRGCGGGGAGCRGRGPS